MSGRVAIVGAGLAGLRCAGELHRAGAEVVVVESADRVGGRATTDDLDGFRLDRGFQVLLTAYPAARAALDMDGLGLGAFRRGAIVSRGGRLSRVADPAEAPLDLLPSLASGVAGPADALRLARMRRRLLRSAPAELLADGPEVPAAEALLDRGFGQRLRQRFLRPFLSGVFCERSLDTSSRLMDVYLRSFAAGQATLPEGGIDAMPRQLAAALPAGSVRLGEKAVRVEAGFVELRTGEGIEADAVVLAADGVSASELDQGLALEPWNPVACIYFDAPEPPVRGPWLVLDGDGVGPVNHLAVPSEVAPGYAPEGRSLISANVVNPIETDDEALRAEVVEQLGRWFGAQVERWSHLRTYRIEHALPFRPPGTLTPGGRSARLESGVYCCGDHRDTPSIQGALYSGSRIARAVLEELAPRPLARVER